MFHLIQTAQAVGTLTSASTATIIQNGVDSVAESLIDNFPKILLPMIVIGLFLSVAYWLKNGFRNKI